MMRDFCMSEKKKASRSFKEYVRIYFTGAIMGGADIVPGVSGGTMAFILGVYEELIESIKSFTSTEAIAMGFTFQIKKAFQTLPWPFLFTLGLGIVTAFAVLSSPIHWLLENQPVLIWAFFFGLVAASVFTVFNRVRKWTPVRMGAMLAGAIAGYAVVGLPLLQNPPDSYIYLVFCGAAAICAMILPGISGSFILLLLGKYEFILNAVNELKAGVNLGQNLLTLAVFIAGLVIGISSFVRLLSWQLRKFHDFTIAILIGFMIGSLRKVWPWKGVDERNILPTSFDTEFWSAIGLALAGFLLVVLLEAIARQLEKKPAERKKEA
jgi:Predicted membrane protein